MSCTLTRKSSCNAGDRWSPASSTRLCVTSAYVVPPLSALICSSATPVRIRTSAISPAATGIVPSVSRRLAIAGSARQAASLLPVAYSHVVFTLPEQLAPLALRNQRLLYDLLFRAASETLLQIAADPRHLGARIGVLAVLHTWSQNLRHHPHLHCLVPAGGLALDHSRWIACRPGFFLPVRVLSRLFRGKMLAFLQQAYKKGELRCLGTTAKPGRTTSVPLPVAPAALQGVGRLCQATLRRTRACAEVPGPLHPPRRHR